MSMRIVKNVLIAGAIITMLAHPLYAQMKGASMGRMLSVVSDGPFDAGRNPALLILQQGKHAAGASYQYKISRKYEADASLTAGTYEIDETSSMAMSGDLAYSLKLSDLVLGLSLARNELKDSYASTSTKSTATVSELPSVRGQYEETKTKELNPVFGASLAIPVSKDSSLGLQLLTGYYYSKATSSSSLAQDGSISSFINSKKRTQESIAAELGFGYQYTTPQTQLGFLLRSGKLSVESERMSFRYAGMLEGSEEFSSFWSYQGGINITAGGYRRLAPFLALSLEATFSFESNYPNRDMELNISTSTGYPALEKAKYDVSAKNIIYLKGGIEVNPIPQLAVTLGGGYTYIAVSNRRKNYFDKDIKQDISSEIYFFTGGLHYAITPKISLSLLAQATKSSSDVGVQQMSRFIELDVDVFTIDTGIAAVMAF